MARRKTASVTHAGKDVVVVTPPPAAPITRRRRSSGGVSHRKKTRRRRSSSSIGVGGGGYHNKMIATGLGGLIYGFIEKTWPNMPTIPILGKSGTIAGIAYFLGPRHQIVRDVGIAAAAIAGYSFGKTGAVSGWEEED